MLQQIVGKEHSQNGSYRDQATLDHFIEIIPSCESIQFLDEKMIIASLPHALAYVKSLKRFPSVNNSTAGLPVYTDKGPN